MLSLHYNGSNSFWFANAVIICQLKAKVRQIKPCTLCLGTISRDFTIDKMKKTELNVVVKVFSFDYNAIDTNNILDIQKYLMRKKHNIK